MVTHTQSLPQFADCVDQLRPKQALELLPTVVATLSQQLHNSRPVGNTRINT